MHTHKSKAGVVGRLAAFAAGVPVVVHTFHGHTFHGYFSPFKSFVFQMIERLLAHRTQAIIAVSAQQRQELLAYGIASPKRLHAIPLGLDLDRYLAVDRKDQGFRKELGIASDVPLVGMVTRLVPIKGVEIFLKAVQTILSLRPDAEFVVVGDGELRSELEQLTRQLGLAERVRFLGFREDTPYVYAALDLVVMSSFNEGLPVTLIEALAAGCYVVSTRVGGVPDLVDSPRIGAVVPPNDPTALAHQVVQVLQEGRRVSLEDRQRIGRDYGIARLVDDLDHLYQMLLKCTALVGSPVVGSARERVC